MTDGSLLYAHKKVIGERRSEKDDDEFDRNQLSRFVCLFAGGLVGMLLRAKLPEHHFSSDSKDAVKLGMALISTMSALDLGLFGKRFF